MPLLNAALDGLAEDDLARVVREEVALMGNLNWVVREVATEVEEAGAFLDDEAVE